MAKQPITTHVEDCPKVTTLQDFLSGKLDESDISDIEAHLNSCSPCGDTVRSLKIDDTLFQLARQANKDQDSSAENLIVDDLIAQYRDLPTDVGSETTAEQDSVEDILQARVNEVITRLAVADNADEVGRLAHYRLLKLLGVGGMGVVYLAEDTQLERMVALKILRPSLGQAARQRFLLEARAAAGVDHDHVITIYQVGEENQLAFIAMQWLDGETLETRLERDGEESNENVASIGRQLALGLAAAHAQSVVHRDIKPANVWLESNRSRARILDFGLARAVNENPQLTETGMIAGTPAYMSPEQARGEAVDHRSDLFSLGCVLYRMATGQLPFEAANPLATIMAIQSHQPEAPRKLNPIISERLSSIILWLLEKNPNDRLESAGELANLLQQPVGKSIHQPSFTAANTALQTDSSRTRSTWKWAMVAALVVLLFGSAFAAPTIYRFATGQGMLTVKISDPNVKVSVLKDGEEYRIVDSQNNSINIKAGSYELKLQGTTKARLEKNSVTLSVGGKETISIVQTSSDNTGGIAADSKFNPGAIPNVREPIQPGDVLGIFVEGVMGNSGTSPPVHYPPGEPGGAPTLGYPVVVDDEGNITLPLIEPIKVTGMKIAEVRKALIEKYEGEILKPGESRILVCFMRSHKQIFASPSYKVQPGAILGVYIEDVLGEADQEPPLNFPPAHTGLAPALGFPIPVQEDGVISLPLVEPITVQSRKISEIRTVVAKAYEEAEILRPGTARILVSLIRPHDYQNPASVDEDLTATTNFADDPTLIVYRLNKDYAIESVDLLQKWFKNQANVELLPLPSIAADGTARLAVTARHRVHQQIVKALWQFDPTTNPVDSKPIIDKLLGYWSFVELVSNGRPVNQDLKRARVVFSKTKMLFLVDGKLTEEGSISVEPGDTIHRIRYGTSAGERLGVFELDDNYLRLAFNIDNTKVSSEFPAGFDGENLRIMTLLRDRSVASPASNPVASDSRLPQIQSEATPNPHIQSTELDRYANSRPSSKDSVITNSTAALSNLGYASKDALPMLRQRLLENRSDGRGRRNPEIELAITSITGYEPIHIKKLSIAVASLEGTRRDVGDDESERWMRVSPAIQDSLDLDDKRYTTKWAGIGGELDLLRAKVTEAFEQELLNGYPAVASIVVENSVPSLVVSIPTKAGDKLKKFTEKNIGKYLMVMINDRVVMVPRIQSTVSSEIQLSGRFTVDELQKLANP